MSIGFIFFDFGGTLGERKAQIGRLVLYPTTIDLLTTVRDVLNLRMGIITTLGPLTDAEGRQLLAQAGIGGFFEPEGFVSEHRVNGQGKPRSAIYEFAAHAVGVTIENCLFVGEDPAEVIGAMAAGMQGILKPRPVK